MKQSVKMNHVIFRTILLVWGGLICGYAAHAQQAKHLDKPKFAAIPVINYNKSFGGMFGAFGSMYFSMSKTDTISPASMVNLGGMVTTNKTWFSFGIAKLYYHEDLLRTVIAGGVGRQNFQFYQEIGELPGTYVPYSTLSNFVFIQQQIKVYGRLYAGLDFLYYNVKTTLGENDVPVPSRNYVALGIPVSYDSRNNVQNPSEGYFTTARLNRFDQHLGSATEYTKLDIDASNYFGFDSSHIIATKVSVSTALGGVPFEAQTVVGGKVLRGYSEGTYRGDQVYSLQSEFRWRFYKKWGAVFFAGLATPVSDGVKWSSSDVLPSGGAGIRYMMIPDLRLNVGLDAAVGKGDYGIYFRIGEAF